MKSIKDYLESSLIFIKDYLESLLIFFGLLNVVVFVMVGIVHAINTTGFLSFLSIQAMMLVLCFLAAWFIDSMYRNK